MSFSNWFNEDQGPRGKPGMVFYKRDECVYYEGSTYIALTHTRGNAPTGSPSDPNWSIVAEAASFTTGPNLTLASDVLSLNANLLGITSITGTGGFLHLPTTDLVLDAGQKLDLGGQGYAFFASEITDPNTPNSAGSQIYGYGFVNLCTGAGALDGLYIWNYFGNRAAIGSDALPRDRLDVHGGIVVGAALGIQGNVNTPAPGCIQFANGHFQGYNGSAWVQLDN